MISYCTVCGINRTIEREVNLNATCLLLLLIWFRLIICTVRLLFRSLFKFSSCERKTDCKMSTKNVNNYK